MLCLSQIRLGSEEDPINPSWQQNKETDVAEGKKAHRELAYGRKRKPQSPGRQLRSAWDHSNKAAPDKDYKPLGHFHVAFRVPLCVQ